MTNVRNNYDVRNVNNFEDFALSVKFNNIQTRELVMKSLYICMLFKWKRSQLKRTSMYNV